MPPTHIIPAEKGPAAGGATERERTEERLREQAALLDLTHDAILVRGMDGRISFWNRSAAEMYGWTAAEAVGAVSRELLRTRFPAPPEEIEAALLRDGCWDGERVHERRDGRSIVVASRWVLRRDADGRAVAVMEIDQDVTERRVAEQEIRETNAALQALVQSSPLAIMAIDPEGRTTIWNPAAERIFGWTAGEVLGGPLPLIPEEMREEHLQVRERGLRGEGVQGMEVTRVRKDGSRIPISLSTASLRDAGGEACGLIAVCEDITGRRRAQDELRKSAERFRSLIENATDIIAILDADGVIRYESPALERVLGHPVHEMVGTNAFDSIHPDDRPAVLERFAHALEAPDRVITLEYRFRCRDGSWRVLESNGQNLLDNPAVGGIVVNSRDVTERRVAEEALAAQARELKRSNQELEQFAYVASHDLQEPLRKIQAFGDRLRSRYAAALGEQGADYVARMQNAASRMQVLIQDLLSFSRVTSKAAPFVPVALEETAREVLSDLQVRLQATGGRVEVGELPVVEGDATQMRQLLQNLIGNALKFHREGVPPVVRIGSAAPGGGDAGGPRTVEIRVADNGIGFEERYLDRIFDPFQRLHGRMEFEGTGMGLAICRKIVERHGGEITATSRPGEGSTFVITLPAR